MTWLDKLERKFGRFYIPNLMLIITIGIAFVYLVDSYAQINIASLLYLDRSLVFSGQIWRLITFVFVPQSGQSTIFLILTLYFYYFSGRYLEEYWGSFRFNVYYLSGIIITVIVALITGVTGVTGEYVNLSLFFAFAKLFPDMELLFMFFIPIKVKYLGYLNWAILLLETGSALLRGDFLGALLVVVPIINYLIFFGKSNYNQAKRRKSSVIRMKDYKKKIKTVNKEYTHKCEVCGKTDTDYPDMEFRYCSKCEGQHCYCSEHIFDHIHVKS